MSECQGCGRYSPVDSETGYQGDAYCPDCRRDLQQAACVRCGKVFDYLFGREPRPDYCSHACQVRAAADEEAGKALGELMTDIGWGDLLL